MTTAAQLLAPPPATPQARAVQFATGFDPLDLAIGGFRAHDLAIVGGRPGVGKTVVALQWARQMAMCGQTVVYAGYDHTPAALVRRLLAIELRSLARPDELSGLPGLRALAEEVVLGAVPLQALTAEPLGEEATLRLREYGSRIHLVRPATGSSGVAGLARLVTEHRSDATALIVDSIQQVAPHRTALDSTAHTDHVVAQLKDLAMVAEIPVIGVSGVDHAGLTARRVQLHHLEGASALAHEADVVILLNDKRDVVAPHAGGDGSERWTVFSIEKHLEGAADLHLEFRQDLANFRFDPAGGFVTGDFAAATPLDLGVK
ncbi:MAG: DnaB-like helicase C-terminal domain-containing protein [Acidimicrobiia bacterium]